MHILLQTTDIAIKWYDYSAWDWKIWSALIMGTLVTIMLFVWGGVRFWLVVTRPPKIKEVHTPTLDRLNQKALDHMADPDAPPEEEEVPPADLLAVVPEEETPKDQGPKKS